MALNINDITLQKLVLSLSQLVEQLQVSKASKKDLEIEDVIKSLNMTFKTSKGDITELKNLLKISKNTKNSGNYDKLIKMLELMIKSYNSPDVKQMQRLGVTSNNLINEISTLKDEIKTVNIKSNDKANLSLLSQAVAQGQRQYAISGFGKYSSDFYKKATLEQMKILKQIDMHIEKGIPLKGLEKKNLLEKAKDVVTAPSVANPMIAAADIAFKAMGLGTLPGEIVDVFGPMINSIFSKKEKDGKKEEAQKLKVEGLMESKEKAQLSLDYNKEIQKKAEVAKTIAEKNASSLNIDLSKSIADAISISGKVDARFKSDKDDSVDIDKVLEALNNNQISKLDIDKIVEEASKNANNYSDFQGTSSELLKMFDQVSKYSEVIKEQDQIISDSAVAIQGSIDSIASIFIDLREIFGKELKYELQSINKIFSQMKNIDEDTKESLKREKIDLKIQSMMEDINVKGDEISGIIGGDFNSIYMRQYEEQADKGGSNKISGLAKEAFNETSFREALEYNQVQIKLANEQRKSFEDTVSKNETLNKLAPAPISVDLQKTIIAENEIREVKSAKDNTETESMSPESELSYEEMSVIISESMNEFLKNFEDLMKEREKENVNYVQVLKNALVSGEVKVKVMNLNEIPQSQQAPSPQNVTPTPYSGNAFGD